MNKRFSVQTFFIIVLLLIFIPQISAQKLSVNRRQQAVDMFLSVWLVRKDAKSAIKFFSPKAFSFDNFLDGYGLDEYISKDKNLNSVKQGVVQFFDDYSVRTKGNSLNAILFLRSSDSPETSENISAMLLKKSFNHPLKDNYYLVNFKFLPKNWQHEYRKLFGNRFSLPDSFITVIQYRILNEDERYGDDIFFVILWTKDRGLWKITQIADIDVEGT